MQAISNAYSLLRSEQADPCRLNRLNALPGGVLTGSALLPKFEALITAELNVAIQTICDVEYE